MYTKQHQKEWFLQAMGCSEPALTTLIKGASGSMAMLAMSILSDTQEVILRGNTETARQYINRAKYVIQKDSDRNREALQWGPEE